jgi:hypothetical protein
MVDQSGAKLAGPRSDEARAFVDRAPRCTVRIAAVLCHPPGSTDVIVAQLVNVSETGMFLACAELLPVGTAVEFRFRLDDDLIALAGTAEVVRLAEQGERGMGLRFSALDGEGRRIIADLVGASAREPPPVPSTPIQFEHGCLRIVLTAGTARYFTYNPLLHIGVGGCFVPADQDVPLGTGYQLDVVDAGGRLVLRCKAKVAAKQERRLGIRLIDVDRAELLRLRAEITRLAPST